MSLRAHREALPASQQQLWGQLKGLDRLGFVLYGGTAIALRLGHRTSVDFDFFAATPLDRQALQRLIPWLAKASVLQDQPDALTVLSTGGGVKVSFFAGLTIGCIQPPQRTDDGVLLVASAVDLLATKLKVLLQRAERKDYQDVAALLDHGLSLSEGLAGALALYGPTFQPSEALKALVYFGDGDLPQLAVADRSTLHQAVLGVGELPRVQRCSDRILPGPWLG